MQKLSKLCNVSCVMRWLGIIQQQHDWELSRADFQLAGGCPGVEATFMMASYRLSRGKVSQNLHNFPALSYVTCHMSNVTCDMSHVTCHMSHVQCHTSHVTCDISNVTCHMPHVTCPQSRTQLAHILL